MDETKTREIVLQVRENFLETGRLKIGNIFTVGLTRLVKLTACEVSLMSFCRNTSGLTVGKSMATGCTYKEG